MIILVINCIYLGKLALKGFSKDYTHYYLIALTTLFNISISFAITQTAMVELSYLLLLNIPIILSSFFTNYKIPESTEEVLKWRDTLLICGLTIVVSIPMLFALDVVPDFFEGELSPYFAAGTSIRGSLFANLGWRGPWAPLGLLYYVPLWFTEYWLGPTILAVRLGAYLPGILALPLAYLLALKLHSRIAAIIASLLILLSTITLGWNRSDIHPHGATLWPSLLMSLVLYNYLTNKTRFWTISLIAVTALTWHQYPSGQILGLLPIGAGCILMILQPTLKPNRSAILTTLFFCALIVIWVAQSFIPEALVTGEIKPFRLDTIYGTRTAWGSTPDHQDFNLSQMIIKLSTNASQLIWGLLYNQEPLFFQTFLPNVAEPERRATLPWIIVPLAITGLVSLLQKRRMVAFSILTAWLLLAPLPAIFSSAGYPKRAATLYPALNLIASIGTAELLLLLTQRAHALFKIALSATVTTLFAFYYAHQLNAYFFYNTPSFKQPTEVQVAQAITKKLTPNTVVIGLFWDHYFHGKYGYLLNQELKEADGSIYFLNSFIPPDKVNAETVQAAVNNFWLYWSTQLRTMREHVSQSRIENILYIIQSHPPAEDQDFIANANSITSDSRCKPILNLEHLKSEKHQLIIYDCNLDPFQMKKS